MNRQIKQAMSILIMSILCTITTNVFAFTYQQGNENFTVNQATVAHSIGQSKNELTLEQRKSYWQENKQALLKKSIVLTKPTTIGTTRQEHLSQKQKTKQTLQLNKAISNSNIGERYSAPSSFNHYDSFSIYNAASYLLDDIDSDGYYQSFSVTFDADFYPISYADYANVYAELYLSRDGGPWVHYYSTDIFTIYGESEEDEYEVTSTLEQGFISGSYDVLIDLYDADFEELVVSYSANDNNALYALPLESSNFDQIYETEVIYTHGGSTTLFICLLITTAFFIRQRRVL